MDKNQEQSPLEPSAPEESVRKGPEYTYSQSGYLPQPPGYTPYPQHVPTHPGQVGYGHCLGYQQECEVQQPSPMGNQRGYGFQQTSHVGYPQGYGTQQSSTIVVTNQPNRILVAHQRPTNWLIPAIFGCLCFWPIGICAIVAANNANRAADIGDYIEAENQAGKARNFVISSFVTGIVIYVLIITIGAGIRYKQLHH